MSLADFNFALFHCNEEEREAGCGGVYGIPDYGDLVYAGLHGKVCQCATLTVLLGV